MAALSQERLDEHVRPEIQAIVKRGGITLAEYQSLRGNSWEWEHIATALGDEAFTAYAENVIRNCQRHATPYVTYDEACSGFVAPELLKRWTAALAEVERLRAKSTKDDAIISAINFRAREDLL